MKSQGSLPVCLLANMVVMSNMVQHTTCYKLVTSQVVKLFKLHQLQCYKTDKPKCLDKHELVHMSTSSGISCNCHCI